MKASDGVEKTIEEIKKESERGNLNHQQRMEAYQLAIMALLGRLVDAVEENQG